MKVQVGMFLLNSELPWYRALIVRRWRVVSRYCLMSHELCSGSAIRFVGSFSPEKGYHGVSAVIVSAVPRTLDSEVRNCGACHHLRVVL